MHRHRPRRVREDALEPLLPQVRFRNKGAFKRNAKPLNRGVERHEGAIEPEREAGGIVKDVATDKPLRPLHDADG